VTAAQVRQVVAGLIEAGHWYDGDPDILVVFDSGYDLTRLAWLLADLPVEIMGRLRSDRVMYFPAPARLPGANGRPVRHGAAFKFSGERSWPAPAVTAVTETTRYGTARAAAWGRLHQRLASRAGWEHHDGDLPVHRGHLIRLHVDHLPGNRSPDPLWLWSSRAGTSAGDTRAVDVLAGAPLDDHDVGLGLAPAPGQRLCGATGVLPRATGCAIG